MRLNGPKQSSASQNTTKWSHSSIDSNTVVETVYREWTGANANLCSSLAILVEHICQNSHTGIDKEVSGPLSESELSLQGEYNTSLMTAGLKGFGFFYFHTSA